MGRGLLAAQPPWSQGLSTPMSPTSETQSEEGRAAGDPQREGCGNPVSQAT